MAEGKTLFAKLAKVLGEVGRVEKRGYNEHFRYAYVMESDLADAVRDKLAAAGICVFFSVEDVTREGTISTARCTLTFADGETGETYTVGCWGTGDDKSDKGAFKAFTGAMKYALMKNFLVPTGDDPDEAEPKKRQRQQQQADKPSQPRPVDGAKPNGITTEQNRKVFALANKLKIDPTFMRESIHARYSVSSSRDLTTAQASDLIKRLEQVERGEAEAEALMPTTEQPTIV